MPHENRYLIVNNVDWPEAEVYSREFAELMIRDHAAAGLVGELQQALAEMCDKFYPHQCKFHGPAICDRCEALRQASKALTAARKAGV